MDGNLEVGVARLEERFSGLEAVMKQLADDQRRLTQSYAELVKSNERLAIMERDMDHLRARVEDIEDHQQARDEAAAESRRTFMTDIFTWAAIGGLGWFAHIVFVGHP